MKLPEKFKFLNAKSMTKFVAEQAGADYAITFNGLPSKEVEHFPAWAVADFIEMFWWIPIESEYSKNNKGFK